MRYDWNSIVSPYSCTDKELGLMPICLQLVKNDSFTDAVEEPNNLADCGTALYIHDAMHSLKPVFHSNAIACVGKQPILVATASTEHSYWLALAYASACLSCGFRLRNARNASDCVWMETGPNSVFIDVSVCSSRLRTVSKRLNWPPSFFIA